jgi:predicted O-methyltransferase YrrM
VAGFISGFVVSYNKQDVIETCLRSIRFVDELVVLDKSSTDRTPHIARAIADRVVTVPWSPTVEGTRTAALTWCHHDSIVFLDDDECFSVETIRYLNHELRTPTHDLYSIPCRHHVLGRHDDRAYYWPERHIRAFRRGAIDFRSTVHGGNILHTENVAVLPFESDICFHNISHADTKTWIEKTNRYTDQKDRAGSVEFSYNLLADARQRLDYWSDTCGAKASGYEQAVALLRAIYDAVDLVKHWEQVEGIDGVADFADTCRALRSDYDALEGETGINTSTPRVPGTPASLPSDTTALIAESDKHFWHRYTDTYLQAFTELGAVSNVLEFGVHQGASIRWLASCFPVARLTGVDILPRQPTWPVGAQFKYKQIDQGNRAAIRSMLIEVPGDLDLIIEDGSHIPQHQASCLIEGLRKLRPGGLYIVEDICTSHPLQEAFAHHSIVGGMRVPNALNVLLAIQHRHDTGRGLDEALLAQLVHPDFFSIEDVVQLDALAGSITIFKRTQLPLHCYACGGAEFDYVAWRCRCGAELYEPANSMAALVWKSH